MFLGTFMRVDDIEEAEIIKKFEKLSKEEFLKYYTKDLRQIPEKAGAHINWFTFKKLNKMLLESGFKDIYKSKCGKSKFKEMQSDKFDTRPFWSLHVEAIK